MKVTKDEVKKKLVEVNGSDKFGTVFDAVCETICHYHNLAAGNTDEAAGKTSKSDAKVDKGI